MWKFIILAPAFVLALATLSTAQQPEALKGGRRRARRDNIKTLQFTGSGAQLLGRTELHAEPSRGRPSR